MTHEEQFEDILFQLKTKSIIPFLQSLSKKERRGLTKVLKKHNKIFLKNIYGHTQPAYDLYKRACGNNHRYILAVSNIVCLNFTEFQACFWSQWTEFFDAVLPWYVPIWFDDFVEKESNSERNLFKYEYHRLMKYKDAGYFRKPIPEKLLSGVISHISLEDLCSRTDNINEHIWYFFRYECEQNYHFYEWYDPTKRSSLKRKAYITKQGKESPYRWYGYFSDLIYLEKIPRQRVLTETLAATHSHFNKALLCWFAGLFEFLEPTHDEVIELQDNLFAVFQSTHSKPVNIALKYLAKIAKDDAFDAQEFLNQVPQLFSSTVKATHNATFKVLNVLVKNKAHQLAVLLAATHAFFISDAVTQGKAVKLIKKYGKTDDAELTESLSMYFDTMLSQTKQDLADFLGSDNEVSELPEILEFDEQLVPIKPIDTFDDLVFLLPSVFENNHIYDYELALDGLVRLQDALIPENYEKLTPAFSAAYKYLRTPRWDFSTLLDLYAIFLVDLLRDLAKKYPDENVFSALDERFVKQYEKEDWRFDIVNETLETVLKGCFVKYDGLKRIEFSEVFWLFLEAKKRIKNNRQLPFLSTPTYCSSMVDVDAFLVRVSAYEQTNDIHTFDFQASLYRLNLNGLREKGIGDKIRKQFGGELLDILHGMSDGNINPPKKMLYPEWWMTADLICNPTTPNSGLKSFPYADVPRELLTGNVPWQIQPDSFTYPEWENGKQIEKKVTWMRLAFLYPESKYIESSDSYWNGLIYYETKKSKLWIEKLLKLSILNGGFYELFSSFVPNQFGHVIHLLITQEFSASDVSEVEPTKALTQVTEQFSYIQRTYSDIELLLIAKTLICDVKAQRQFMAELWLRRQSHIDNALLGQILGKLEALEHAPLKRFTDLIQDNMLNISQVHNHALLDLLLAMLVELPEKPVKGLKKLLEILVEVLKANKTDLKSVASDELMLLLNAWQKVANLKKVVKILVSD